MNHSFKCVDCGREYEETQIYYVCPDCLAEQEPMEPTRGVLKVIYDYDRIKKELCTAGAKDPARTAGFFASLRMTEFLTPLHDLSLLPPLKVGPTPLYNPHFLHMELGSTNVYIKDDTGLPTGSFKDRASYLVVAKAREFRHNTIVCASTGNAATALAGMCASVGVKCVIFVPASAPIAKLTQILILGARLIPIKGTYDDAFELSIKATREFGWYNRNTAYNPFTIEGKKTAAFEIWQQLGGVAPDKILIPTGDGVILAGIYKGFWDLLQLGLVEKMPQLIAVQAQGSSAIANMLKGGRPNKRYMARTIADSISVNAPRNANWAVKAIRETNGQAITVTDDEIISAISHLGRLTGIFAEPAAAAAAAGLFKMAPTLERREKVVVLITGTGLKDIPAAQKAIQIPKAIEPDISLVDEYVL